MLKRNTSFEHPDKRVAFDSKNAEPEVHKSVVKDINDGEGNKNNISLTPNNKVQLKDKNPNLQRSSVNADQENSGIITSSPNLTKKRSSIFDVFRSPSGENRSMSSVVEELSRSFTISTTGRVKSLKKAIGPVTAGRFAKWTRYELVEILVEEKVEVRGQKFVSLERLRELVEAVYDGYDTPSKPTPHTKESMARRDAAAALIQSNWIVRQSKRNSMRTEGISDNAQLYQHVSKARTSISDSGVGSMTNRYSLVKDVNKRDLQLLHVRSMMQKNSVYSGFAMTNEGLVPTDASTPDPLLQSALLETLKAHSLEADDIEMGNKGSKKAQSKAPVAATMVERQLVTASDYDVNASNLSVTATSCKTVASAEGRSQLETPWVPPYIEFARLYANFNHPRKGGLGGEPFDLCNMTTGRHCCRSGWGEQCNLWQEGAVSELIPYGPGITNYFKFLKWCFWIFCLMSVTYLPILIFNLYGVQQAKATSPLDISRTMVGNLAISNHTLAIHLPGCYADNYHFDCMITEENIAILFASLNAFVIFFVIIGFVWLLVFQEKEERDLNEHLVSAADFTVMVSGIPRDITFTEMELRKHFAKITGHAVVKVVIAYDNEYEISQYRKRGALLEKRHHITQMYRFKCSAYSKKFFSHEQLTDIIKKRNEITIEIREIDIALKARENYVVPLFAFVTFEEKFGAHVAIRMYNRSVLGYLVMPDHLIFKGCRLEVNAAPEPSTIIWENLGYGIQYTTMRRCVTLAVSVILLLCSIVASFVARSYYLGLTSSGGNEPCPGDWTSYSTLKRQAYVQDPSHPGSLHCYCDQFSYYRGSSDSICDKYLESKLIANLFLILSTGVVLFVNQALESAMRTFAHFEKHRSIDAMELSVFWRLFFLKFVNMGCVSLFSNSFVFRSSDYQIIYSGDSVFNADWYKSAGISILLVQAVNIFFAQAPKLLRYLRSRRRIAAVEKDSSSVLSQIDLNKMHLGPDFMLSHRYAQLMSSFFVCYMYPVGIPILAFVGLANFAVTYWVEKFLFLRFYRNPPRYSTRIGRRASFLVLVAVIVNIIMSCWQLNNEEIFPVFYTVDRTVSSYTDSYSGSMTVSQALKKLHILILVILGAVVLLLIALRFFWSYGKRASRRIRKLICGDSTEKSMFLEEVDNFLSTQPKVTYTRALQRGLIQGLPNYNILQNPKYKEDFAISDKFALTHNHVKSVRKFLRLSERGEEEDRVAPLDKVAADPHIIAYLRAEEKIRAQVAAGTHSSNPSGASVAEAKPGAGKSKVFLDIIETQQFVPSSQNSPTTKVAQKATSPNESHMLASPLSKSMSPTSRTTDSGGGLVPAFHSEDQAVLKFKKSSPGKATKKNTTSLDSPVRHFRSETPLDQFKPVVRTDYHQLSPGAKQVVPPLLTSLSSGSSSSSKPLFPAADVTSHQAREASKESYDANSPKLQAFSRLPSLQSKQGRVSPPTETDDFEGWTRVIGQTEQQKTTPSRHHNVLTNDKRAVEAAKKETADSDRIAAFKRDLREREALQREASRRAKKTDTV